MVTYEEIWDDISLRIKIEGDSNLIESYNDLSLFTEQHVIEIHRKVSEIGITSKVGVRSNKYLKQVYNEFQKNVDDRIDIF